MRQKSKNILTLFLYQIWVWSDPRFQDFGKFKYFTDYILEATLTVILTLFVDQILAWSELEFSPQNVVNFRILGSD